MPHDNRDLFNFDPRTPRGAFNFFNFIAGDDDRPHRRGGGGGNGDGLPGCGCLTLMIIAVIFLVSLNNALIK